MSRPLANTLQDILDAIDRVESYINGKSFEDLPRVPMLNDAIERCIERISEASRNVSDDIKGDYPTVPWHDIATIGNRIRHGYFSVDPRIIWDTATLDLPALRQTILDIQRRHAAGGGKAENGNEAGKP